MMDSNQYKALLDQLERSFLAMPRWAQAAAVHAMGAPKINPATGLPFGNFCEILLTCSDSTLETLRDDFADNGDLLPAVPTQ